MELKTRKARKKIRKAEKLIWKNIKKTEQEIKKLIEKTEKKITPKITKIKLAGSKVNEKVKIKIKQLIEERFIKARKLTEAGKERKKKSFLKTEEIQINFDAGEENENKIKFFLGEKRINEFNWILKENNSNQKAEKMIVLYACIGFSLALVSIGISSVLEIEGIYPVVFFGLLLVLPGLMHWFFHLFLFEKNKREKEKVIPDILLQASIFPKGTPIIKIIKYISESDYGLMSKEFQKAFNEIQKGKTVEESLKEISRRCRSEIISRAMNLLIQGNVSGAEMNKVFKETAEDILETQSIIKERIASLFIQKYTLILAGSLIVPAILGTITGFINEMNFYGINELGLGMTEETRKAIIETALTANQIYIIEYALIASFFIANQEGNTKKAFVYSLVLVPLGIICYNIALIL